MSCSARPVPLVLAIVTLEDPFVLATRRVGGGGGMVRRTDMVVCGNSQQRLISAALVLLYTDKWVGVWSHQSIRTYETGT